MNDELKTNPADPGPPTVLEAAPGRPLTTPLIEECLTAGCVENLFPVLAPWSAERLRELQRDLETCHFNAQDLVEAGRHTSLAGAPGKEQPINAYFNAASWEVCSIYSEILSVVLYYLSRRGAGAENGGPPDEAA